MTSQSQRHPTLNRNLPQLLQNTFNKSLQKSFGRKILRATFTSSLENPFRAAAGSVSSCPCHVRGSIYVAQEIATVPTLCVDVARAGNFPFPGSTFDLRRFLGGSRRMDRQQITAVEEVEVVLGSNV